MRFIRKIIGFSMDRPLSIILALLWITSTMAQRPVPVCEMPYTNGHVHGTPYMGRTFGLENAQKTVIPPMYENLPEGHVHQPAKTAAIDPGVVMNQFLVPLGFLGMGGTNEMAIPRIINSAMPGILQNFIKPIGRDASGGSSLSAGRAAVYDTSGTSFPRYGKQATFLPSDYGTNSYILRNAYPISYPTPTNHYFNYRYYPQDQRQNRYIKSPYALQSYHPIEWPQTQSSSFLYGTGQVQIANQPYVQVQGRRFSNGAFHQKTQSSLVNAEEQSTSSRQADVKNGARQTSGIIHPVSNGVNKPAHSKQIGVKTLIPPGKEQKEATIMNIQDVNIPDSDRIPKKSNLVVIVYRKNSQEAFENPSNEGDDKISIIKTGRTDQDLASSYKSEVRVHMNSLAESKTTEQTPKKPYLEEKTGDVTSDPAVTDTMADIQDQSTEDASKNETSNRIVSLENQPYNSIGNIMTISGIPSVKKENTHGTEGEPDSVIKTISNPSDLTTDAKKSLAVVTKELNKKIAGTSTTENYDSNKSEAIADTTDKIKTTTPCTTDSVDISQENRKNLIHVLQSDTDLVKASLKRYLEENTKQGQMSEISKLNLTEILDRPDVSEFLQKYAAPYPYDGDVDQAYGSEIESSSLLNGNKSNAATIQGATQDERVNGSSSNHVMSINNKQTNLQSNRLMKPSAEDSELP